MNKFSWFALGSAVTAVGAGIVALIMDDSDESGGSSDYNDDSELTEGDESLENTTSTTDDISMSDTESTDDTIANSNDDVDDIDTAGSDPNNGTDIDPNAEVTSDAGTGEISANMDNRPLIFTQNGVDKSSIDSLK